MRFEYFESLSKPPFLRRRFYWRLRDGNNKIVAVGGEAFVSESNVLRAIENINSEFKTPHPVSRA